MIPPIASANAANNMALWDLLGLKGNNLFKSSYLIITCQVFSENFENNITFEL